MGTPKTKTDVLRSHYLHDIVIAVKPGAHVPEMLIRHALASVDSNLPFTVIGVSSPSFYGARLTSTPPDFYLPLATEPFVKGESSILNKPDTHWLNVIGSRESNL